MTVCDGCLNLDNDDNAGLKVVVDELVSGKDIFFKKISFLHVSIWAIGFPPQEELYPTYGPSTAYGLSRGDFWAVSAIAAVQNGVEASNRQCGTAGE